MIERLDLNDAKEWSEMDIWDLKNHVAHGATLRAISYAAAIRLKSPARPKNWALHGSAAATSASQSPHGPLTGRRDDIALPLAA